MIKHVCDKCEKEGIIKTYSLPFHKQLYNIEYHGNTIAGICSKEIEPIDIELCNNCAEELNQMLSNYGFKEV